MKYIRKYFYCEIFLIVIINIVNNRSNAMFILFTL